jgi:CheY-like chemotaxis protein
MSSCIPGLAPCLSSESASKEILKASDLATWWVKVTVRDTGKGIKTDTLASLFEDFKHANEEDARLGTGLGLSLTRRLMRAMGGDCTLTSKGLGKGATACLDLPVLVYDPLSKSSPAPPQTGPPSVPFASEPLPPSLDDEAGKSKNGEGKCQHAEEKHKDRDDGDIKRSFSPQIPAASTSQTFNDTILHPLLPKSVSPSCQSDTTEHKGPVKRPDGPAAQWADEGGMVVVVDDDSFNRFVLSRLLLLMGIQSGKVVLLDSGSKAVDYFATILKVSGEGSASPTREGTEGIYEAGQVGMPQRYLLIIDLEMPEMNGVDAAIRALHAKKSKSKADPVGHDINIVMLSAQSVDVITEKYPEARPGPGSWTDNGGHIQQVEGGEVILGADGGKGCLFDAIYEKPLEKAKLAEIFSLALSKALNLGGKKG